MESQSFQACIYTKVAVPLLARAASRGTANLYPDCFLKLNPERELNGAWIVCLLTQILQTRGHIRRHINRVIEGVEEIGGESCHKLLLDLEILVNPHIHIPRARPQEECPWAGIVEFSNRRIAHRAVSECLG